jgi:hypothetical protein
MLADVTTIALVYTPYDQAIDAQCVPANLQVKKLRAGC